MGNRRKNKYFFFRAVVESNVPRTSNMEAPIMLLSGHSGEVTLKIIFHPAAEAVRNLLLTTDHSPLFCIDATHN